MVSEKRKDKRIHVSLPIDYSPLEIPEKRCGNAAGKNLSQGGLKIILDKFYPHKTKFLLKVNLESMHRVIESIAETVWSFNESYSNRYFAGLQFTDMNKENKEILKQYLTMQEITG